MPEIYRVRTAHHLFPFAFSLLTFLLHSPLQFYQVRKRYPDGRGAARVNADGDLSPSFPSPSPPSKPPAPPAAPAPAGNPPLVNQQPPKGVKSGPPAQEAHHHSMAGGIIHGEAQDEDDDEEEEDEEWGDQNGISVGIAGKFLAAGGIAGAGTSICP